MKAPRGWRKPRPGLIARALSPLGAIYGAAENAATQALTNPSGCINWGDVGEAAALGALLGGVSIGVAPEGSNGCFSGETLVATESGEKPIRDLHVGERVWSKKPDTGELELHPVVRRFITPDQPLLDLEVLEDGGEDEVIRATPGHRFWVEGQGWLPAADLHEGDVLTLLSGKHAVFERVQAEREHSTVYNLEVEETHSYFVGEEGVWVHNAACGPDAMSKAASDPDRNGLTKAGRALQKHGDRAGSAFPKTKGGPAALNPAGQGIVDDILTTPGSVGTPNRFGGTDVTAPDGRGVRYDGKGNFMGFLEP